jgi:hypothetical protein
MTTFSSFCKVSFSSELYFFLNTLYNNSFIISADLMPIKLVDRRPVIIRLIEKEISLVMEVLS